ncbi:MAG: NAD-dependent epimerase/dehydratase family protein [Proteobacteria bacterium]|nr:NAD-dependent epimerase/dehydratase family protein [Pseudomonadota bacterium]
MPRYLVTGGCGFIGAHLCRALLRDGHAVRVLDDLSTGRRENLPDGAELLVGDVADPACLEPALAGIDGCFHLAAVASVARAAADWLGTNRVNLGGAIALFDAIAKLPPTLRPPVVYASSAAVYGEPAALPIAENAEKHPLSAYGVDKFAMELHAAVAAAVHGLRVVGLRPFNVYGPMQDPLSSYSGVISIFCDRIARGRPVEVFGDGAQTRDFVFVADVVAALTAAMALQPEGAPVFNVCTGTGTSIRTLAETIAALCGRRPQLVFRPERGGEIRRSVGSPDLARASLGLPLPTPLREGLGAVLRWAEAGGFAAPGRLDAIMAEVGGK